MTPKQLCAWCCITVILIACMFMHFGLRWGLPVGTDVAAQIQFIASNEGVWKLGWFFWNLAALSLLCFCALLYHKSNRTIPPTIGLFCVGLGVLPDLYAEYLLSFGLSDLARAALTEKFVALQSLGMQLTGVYANGLYNTGGLILTISLLAHSKLSHVVAGIGIVSWLLGLSLSFFTWVGNFQASELATALSMSLNLLFMALVARKL